MKAEPKTFLIVTYPGFDADTISTIYVRANRKDTVTDTIEQTIRKYHPQTADQILETQSFFVQQVPDIDDLPVIYPPSPTDIYIESLKKVSNLHTEPHWCITLYLDPNINHFDLDWLTELAKNSPIAPEYDRECNNIFNYCNFRKVTQVYFELPLSTFKDHKQAQKLFDKHSYTSKTAGDRSVLRVFIEKSKGVID